MFVHSLCEFLRTVCTGSDQLVTELLQIRFDSAKLTQLLIAVRSPPTPIEDQNYRATEQGIAQLEISSLQRFEAGVGCWIARQ